MSFRIERDNSFKRFLKKIKEKDLKKKVIAAVKDIQSNPYEAGEQKTGDLAGIYCYDIRHGKVDYEIAYIITEDEDGDVIIFLLGGTRENFYKELKRRNRM